MLSCFLGLFASFSSCFIYSLLFLPVLFHVLKIMRKMWLAIRALYIDRLVVEFPFFGWDQVDTLFFCFLLLFYVLFVLPGFLFKSLVCPFCLVLLASLCLFPNA